MHCYQSVVFIVGVKNVIEYFFGRQALISAIKQYTAYLCLVIRFRLYCSAGVP